MKGKKKSILRIARVTLAFLSVVAMTLLFAAGARSGALAFMAKAQLIPSLLAVNVVVLVALLLLTLLVGRLYCSVICPLGITQDLFNWITKKVGGKRQAIRFGYSKPRNVLRYTVLALYAVAVILGIGSVIALLDPYAAFGRIMTDVFGTVTVWLNNVLSGVMPGLFGREEYIAVNALSLSVAIVTLVVVAFMAVRGGRTYCNTICPVGSLLGLISRCSVLKVRIDTDKCNGCGLCGKKCRASCIDTKNHKVDYSRCVDCFDCIDNCNQGAISFGVPVKNKVNVMDNDKSREADDVSRRKFLSALAMVSVAGTKLWAREKVEKVESLVDGKAPERHTAVSPFGSISHKHLNSKCSACHLCIDKCPQKVLRPALREYGLDGLMQPVMDYTVSFCDYDCTLCGEVCPAGAIKPLTLDEKQSTHIGLAVYSKDDCVVSHGTLLCGVCKQACPADAITLVPDYNEPLTEAELETLAEMPADERTRARYRLYPQIDPDLCIGCGACQYRCPTKAIVVNGFSEHR